MTDKQIVLVQESWTKVEPISDTAAMLFYGKLFELDPSLQALFKRSPIEEQGKKLMQMITAAVRGLGDVPKLIPVLVALGERHAGYDVKPAHYDTVAAALLDTLEKGLGDAWNDELKDAWVAVYTTMATVMIDAQNKVTTA